MSARSSSRLYVLGGLAALLALLNVADRLPWEQQGGIADAPPVAGSAIASGIEVEPAIRQAAAAGQSWTGNGKAAPDASPTDLARDSGPHPDPWANIMVKDVLRATVERPLFRASRRPYIAPPPPRQPKPVVVAQPAPAPPDPGGLTLVGIVKGKKGALALLHDRDTGDSKSVRVGDSFLGWTIAGVRNDHVVVRQKAVQAELHLFKQPE